MNIVWLLFLLQAAYAGKITSEENQELKKRCNFKWTGIRRPSNGGDWHLNSVQPPTRFAANQVNLPFAVALSKITERTLYPNGVNVVSNFTPPFCSGVLISPRHILTAAHCLVVDAEKACKQRLILHEGNPQHVSVTLQERNAQDVGVFLQSCSYFGCWKVQGVREVAAVHVHQNYMDVNEACRNSTSYDIAAIELKQNVQISPICMPDGNANIPQNLVSIGYGKYEGDDSLQAVVYNEISRESAIVAYTKYKNESSIPVDSGGPLIQHLFGKHYLLGILSSFVREAFGTTQGPLFTGKVSSRFVDVREHVDWICKKTGVCPLSEGSEDQEQPPPQGPYGYSTHSDDFRQE